MQHEWREGNRVILLPEASRFLPAMFEAVSQAQHYVLVELYLMESGELANQVIDALEAATRRGVKTYLLLDGYGAMGLERSDRERLQAAGVALQLFNPIGFHSLARNLSRDHRKIVVVDGEIGLGGAVSSSVAVPAFPAGFRQPNAYSFTAATQRYRSWGWRSRARDVSQGLSLSSDSPLAVCPSE